MMCDDENTARFGTRSIGKCEAGKTGIFTVVSDTEGKKPLRGQFIFLYKTNEMGDFVKFKVRLVSDGRTNYDEVLAPTPSAVNRKDGVSRSSSGGSTIISF